MPSCLQVTYTCTDSAGQSTTGTRTVTVKANCSVPTVVNQNDTTGYCVEGTTFAHGTTCTSMAQHDAMSLCRRERSVAAALGSAKGRLQLWLCATQSNAYLHNQVRHRLRVCV